MRLPLTLASSLALLLAACGGSTDAKKKDDQPERKPPLVRAVAVQLQAVRLEIRTTGFLESEHQDTIQAQVSGRLLELLVDEGSEVEKSQLLAKIDDRETRSLLTQHKRPRASC